MTHYNVVRQLVKVDKNGTAEPVETHSVRVSDPFKKPTVKEKWYVCFSRAMDSLSRAQPSRFSMVLFLYLIGQEGMTGNELLIPVSEIATVFEVSRQYVHRHLKELVDLSVLLESRDRTRRVIYRFNPRIAWNQTLDKRPMDLTPYPEIGSQRKLFKPKEKTQQ